MIVGSDEQVAFDALFRRVSDDFDSLPKTFGNEHETFGVLTYCGTQYWFQTDVKKGKVALVTLRKR